jgi:prevent-host-death family protein
MKTISAREANHRFSELLSAAERGEEVVITRHGRPVALLSPHRPKLSDKKREAAIKRAVAMMKKGLPWPENLVLPTRDEIHER